MVYKIDRFIDGNPYIEERIERAVEQRVVQRMQRLILDVIKDRFPALVTQAQPQIEQIQDADALEKLFLQLTTVTAERDGRRILQILEKQ